MTVDEYMEGTVETPSGCYEWAGYVQKGKYPRITIQEEGKRKSVVLHRWMWIQRNGAIPEGLSVLHSCDNRLCLNPAHHHLGDNCVNMAEMVQRGRGKNQFGPQKLSVSDVSSIRERYAAGGVLQRELAREHGITAPYISQIVRRVAWAHVS